MKFEILVDLHLQREVNSIRNASVQHWDDFDFSDLENDLPDLPRRTISDGSTPWNNYKELIIGQR